MHDPEKACLALDPGWEAGFGKKIMLKQKKLDHDLDSA